jgi:hypothetical protein
MQLDYVISGLYLNDAEKPVKKFQIEGGVFVLRNVEGCTIASIVDGSWDTEQAFQESAIESYRRLITYLALCAASSYYHLRVEFTGMPHDVEDDGPWQIFLNDGSKGENSKHLKFQKCSVMRH